MNFLYEMWFRKYGIRISNQLISPPLAKLELFELPKKSILHFTSISPLENGPASDDILFRNITRQIMVGHILEVGDNLGNPRHLAVSVNSAIRNYHSKNHRFRIMRSLESATRDQNTLIIYNYGFLPQLYRYMRSYYSEYYKWWNIESAVWKNINVVATETDRQHFIVCKLPEVLPSLSQLLIGSGALNQKIVKIFNSPESLMLLELWKWFGENRKSSVISNVHYSNLDKVNLIFIESGRWFVINLGKMNRWRVATEDELIENPEANTKGYEPAQIQRRFLRLMMSLLHVRTVASPEVTAASDDIKDNKTVDIAENNPDAVPQPVVVSKNATVPEIDKATGIVKTETTTKPLPSEAVYNELNGNRKDDTGDDILTSTDLEKQLEADLAGLEEIANNYLKLNSEDKLESDEVEDIGSDEPQSLEDGVMQVCNRLADNGLLSAAEYRRYDALSKSYKKIASPDGTTTLDEFIKIDPDKLKIETSLEINDISTVIDKSMLRSSLHIFDQKYIKDVMRRDIAGMIMNVQNAGIAVTNYEVEKVNDVMGSYTIHTVRVTPVEGASSMLRFRLPVVEEDGTYMAGNTKYRMRKQRIDLPIRKIAPDRVALTSYYGKTFVSRNTKRVNDYGKWLQNAIMAKGLNNDDNAVINLHPGNVFDNNFKSPKLYSTLAMSFRSFTLVPSEHIHPTIHNSFDLSFDHTKRSEYYGDDVLKQYEKDGAIVVGANSKNQYLVMDKNSSLYLGTNGNLTDFGTLESLLGLELDRAPIDFAEIKVMGKAIPVGIVLGYEIGLEKLLKLLGASPRRVNVGTRVNLEADEYALVFRDETLVFSRDDKKASLILGGFNEYSKAIRHYSVYDFDKRSVYLNVLESLGGSVRYLREIDLMYSMFIDPITKDLLIEMKEPTNFRGLLVRSCEMLMNDQHPDEFDPAYMRIRGYERMAGAVYSEIIKSIRAHNGLSGKSRFPIDLNPYAVWKTIAQDPSIALVNDINPIQNLKEVEAVTYSGVGGRNSRSMTKTSRIYHPNDMGTISESTVDSGDVSINTFTSADPQFTSLRGISKRYQIGKTGPTALLSTSALLAPGSDTDDPKRVMLLYK